MSAGPLRGRGAGRRLLPAVGAALLVAVLTACAATAPLPAVEPVRPVPAGTTVLTGPPPPPRDTSCGDPQITLTPTPPGAPGEVPPGSTMADILARGTLIVGIDQSTVPLSYRDPTTGELAGLDVAIAREMARALFGDPERVSFRIQTSAQRIPNLLDGSVDMVVQAMTVTCERTREVGLSSVYFDAAQRLLVPRSSDVETVADLGGRPVCSVTGTTSIGALQNARDEQGRAPLVVGVPENSDCLVLLQQGQVDAASTDDTILQGFALEDPRLVVRGPSLSPEPYAVAVGPQDTDLLRYVNGVLDRIRADGTWAAIVSTTFGIPAPPPPTPRYAG